MRKYIFFLFFIFVAGVTAMPVSALSCQFSGSDLTVGQGSTSTLNINITNSGPGDSVAIQVANPDNGDFFQFTGGSASGWAANVNSGNVDFTGSTLSESENLNISVQVQGLALTSELVGFTTYVSADGGSFDECGGGINVSVIEPSATNTPTPTSSASSGSTTTTTVATNTVTQTVTKTETKIVEIKDTLPPVVSISGEFDKPFEQAPEIVGRASDKSRIATVEYSIDGGENWLPVDEIANPGQVSTEFRFIPSLFDDGNYEIKVRSIDGAGNKGLSKAQTLIIDRLPPLIGASLFTLGPLILQPNQNGEIITSTGVEQKVTLSAAGGPISIDLFINDSKYQLFKSVGTGLWSGKIKFDNPGIYQIKYQAIDGGGNKTEDNLNNFVVVDPGQVINKATGSPIKNAKISLFQKDEQTGEWYSWDGTPFNQVSSKITNEKGIYNYFLPAGQYYFKVESSGFAGIFSQIFDITTPTPINTFFYLKQTMFPWQLYWETVDISLNIPETISSKNNPNSLLGKITPEFNQLRGKSSLITFLNSWSPPSLDQINILDSLYKQENKRINFQAFAVQEKSSKIDVFRLRGNYSLPFLADPDGTLAQKFVVTSLPTHVFLDRKGVIKKIISGVYTKEALLKLLSSGD